MSVQPEKNILVDRGIPMGPPEKTLTVRIGDSTEVEAPSGNPYGTSGSGALGRNRGWTIGFGGSGGRGEGARGGTLSGSKRRRLRIADKLRRENEARQQQQNAIHQAALQAQAAVQAEQAARAQREAEARVAAEAQARAHAQAQAKAEAEAQARAHAEAQVRAAAQAQAERERVQAAHRQAINALSQAQHTVRADLDKKHSSARAALAELLHSQVRSEVPASSGTGQQLPEAILEEKARVNYLIAQKSGLRAQKVHSAYSFAGADPRSIKGEQYKAILLSRSTTAEQAHQVHTAWATAYADALEVVMLSESEMQLNERSEALSKAYAEQAWALQNGAYNGSNVNSEISIRQSTELNRLWSIVAGPNFPTQEIPNIKDIATEVAKKLFIRQAMKTFARALPHIASFYPTELGNGEMPPAVLATPASALGISSGLDLGFVAGRLGTVDVSHRLSFNEADGEVRTVWAKTDGVTVGTQVRVRSLVFNSVNQTYEFIRDGETAPSLVWTPAITPDSSFTYSPSERPVLPADPGTDVSPIANEQGGFPTYDQVDFDDYIIVFPADSGIDPLYAVFNQRAGDHRYYPRPNTLAAFPNAVKAKAKTPTQGGGSLRHRWITRDGNILEWDSRHGKVELYSKQGKHMGEFDHETGEQTKPADPARRIEP